MMDDLSSYSGFIPEPSILATYSLAKNTAQERTFRRCDALGTSERVSEAANFAFFRGSP